MNAKTKILIVEDEWLIAEITQKNLERLGYEVVSVAVSGEEAVRKAEELKPDLILMDIVLEGKMDGIEAAGHIHSRSGIPIIFQTAYSDEKILELAKKIGPFGYLVKPVHERELYAAVKLALYKHEVDEKLRENQKKLRHALNEALRRRAEVSALLESSRAVLKYRKFEDAARAIFDSCKKVTGAAAGYIALLTEDGSENDVVFLDSGGRPCDVDPNLPMPIRGLRAEAYRTRKAVYDNNFSGSQWISLMPERHVALDNVLFAPLIVEGKALGLMGLANKPKGFTENDSLMAAAFAEHAAIALQNSRALESLENSEARFRAVAESAADAIITGDSSGNIVSWNSGARLTFGYGNGEAIGKPVTILMPERFRNAHEKGLERIASGGESRVIGKTVELVGLRKNGGEFPLELSLSTWELNGERFFTGILHDITERKKIETALRKKHEELERTFEKLKKAQSLLIRQEKLASLGTLSAGVAHEIKNPLNIISTSVQLLQMEDNLSEEAREAYKTIIEQVNRAAKITDNLRDFARERKQEVKEIALHEFLDKTMALVEYEMKGENLQIEKKFHKDPIYINGDEDQLAQVFLNMISNARTSMNKKQKLHTYDEIQRMGWAGRLTVETEVSGQWAIIRFLDKGVGISKENLKKVFDPFFTTNEEGKGTGLGLSIAYGIIQAHGGTIQVNSEEGKGAGFTIYIPSQGKGEN